MYEGFFKLKQKPFELVPNPQFLFMSSTHRRAMNYLQYGFEQRAGFILLTGDIGAGKTTLLRELITRLDDQAVIARVFNTQIDPSQLLGLINMDFGLDVTTLDKVTLLKDLNSFLINQYAQEKRSLLIIDEAQNLSNETLEEIRLLSNLESDSEKLLQIVMVGQPELQTNLDQEALTQLRQRLSVSCHLGTLSAEETKDYFYHRLECAGNRSAISIPQEMFEKIHAACNGVPRLINILGDYLLLAAFSDQVTDLSAGFVEEVIEEIQASVAFYCQKKSACEDLFSDPVKEDRKSGSLESEQEILETLQLVREKQQKHETILKKITRKQIVQIDTIQDQLDAIGSSIHAIELELKLLSKKPIKRVKVERDNLKQVITTIK